MSFSSLPLEPSEKVSQGQAIPNSLDPRTVGSVCENVPNGQVLRCGQFHIWSVPLEFLFSPKENKFTHVVTVHAEIFVLAHEDPTLGRILSQTVNTIDGRVLQAVCQLLYPKHKIIRQNGANFVFDLAEHCVKHSERLFLLGSSEKANACAVWHLRDLVPRLEISGFSPAMRKYPFAKDWNDGILAQIEDFRPQHVVVCLGPKKQEYWIHENSVQLAQLGVRCAYGLGGTIDFLAGVKPRAPKWIEFMGAEWLFRLACEPRARFRRTLTMFRMPFYAAKTARETSSLDGIPRK